MIICYVLDYWLLSFINSFTIRSLVHSFTHQLNKRLKASYVSGAGLDLQDVKIDIRHDPCPQQIYVLD